MALNWPINSSGTHVGTPIIVNGFWGLGKGRIYFLRLAISPRWERARGRISGPLVSVSAPCCCRISVGLFMGPLSFNRVPVWPRDNEMGLQGASISPRDPTAEGGSDELGLLSGW